MRFLAIPFDRLRAARPGAGIFVRRRPDRFTLLIAAIAVAGAALIMARQVGYGVGLVADAPTYLAVADSLLAGQGFVQFSVWPYLLWPPLYPLLLAGASFYVFDPQDVAGPVNAASFGLTIFAVGCCLRRYVRRRFLVVAACLAIMLALPLTSVAAAALSEPLFILLSTLALAQTARFLDRGQGRDLTMAAALTGLALLTRYAGVALVAAILPLLILQRDVGGLAKAKRIAWYYLIAGLPTALWFLHNLLAHGQVQAGRWPSPYRLTEVLEALGNDLAGWTLLFPDDSTAAAAVFVWMGLAALAAGVIYALARLHGRPPLAASARPDGAGHFRRRGNGRAEWALFYLFGGFALAYLALLVIAQTNAFLEDWNGRYLTPAYIPLLVAAIFGLDRLLSYAARRNWRWVSGEWPVISAVMTRSGTGMAGRLAIAVALVVCVWLAWGAALNVRDIRASNFYGAGLAGREWINSEVLQYLRQLPVGSVFYSNSLAVYLHTDHTAYRFVPLFPVDGRANILKEPDGAYLVWFYDGLNGGNFEGGVPALRQIPELEPVAELADGLILKVNREYEPATDYYQEAYAGIAAGNYGSPAARSVYGIYHRGNMVFMVKEPCVAADIDAKFLLHIIPVDDADLPRYFRKYGHEIRDFAFQEYGVAFDGKCLVAAPLPDYDIAGVRTGQFVSRAGRLERLWEAEFATATDYYRATYADIAAGNYGAPKASSSYDIYYDENRLIYAREPCAAADIEAQFVLHIVPVDDADLPRDRRQYGYDNRDFNFRKYGMAFDGICLAVVPLPDYDIFRIRTGQYVPDAGRLWTAEFLLAGGFGPPPAR